MDSMTPQLQAAIKQWSTLLNEALARHAARRPERILDSSLVKASIVMRLRDTGVTGTVYDQWLAGEAYPNHEQHEALLGILKESSSEEEIETLENARDNILAVKHATKIPDKVHSTVSRSSTILSRHDKGPLIWLRTIPRQIPYEELNSDKLNDTLLNTPSAAEFLHCFRVKYFPGISVFEAARRAKFAHTVIHYWETGRVLPEPESLAKIKENYFGNRVLTDGTLAYERFEALVNENRRLLMMQALRDGNQKSFGQLLSWLPATVATQELRNFMQPPKVAQDEPQSQAEKAQGLSLIASKGTYLHFLRHAIDLSHQSAAQAIGYHVGTIANMERDNNAASAITYKTYQNYLERKLYEHDAQLTEQEVAEGREPSIKLSDLLKIPEVRARVDALKPVRPPKSYWTAIAEMPVEKHGQGV